MAKPVDELSYSVYATRPITKAPNWHSLIALDVLLNNLTTGLFLVAAIAELARPAPFAVVARAAFPIAWILLLGDLVCLVADLGDPRRFHYMLRLIKPSSPMSLGTWCLTMYAVPLSILVLMDLLPRTGTALEWVHWLCLIAGLGPALGGAIYKGVLFSTSSQPGWKDARWLGAYLANSALVLGCAGLLALSIIMQQQGAADALCPALVLLLLLNMVALALLVPDIRPAMSHPYVNSAAIMAAGILAPGVLLMTDYSEAKMIGVVLVVLGAFIVRLEIVRLPQGAHHVE